MFLIVKFSTAIIGVVETSGIDARILRGMAGSPFAVSAISAIYIRMARLFSAMSLTVTQTSGIDLIMPGDIIQLPTDDNEIKFIIESECELITPKRIIKFI
jgi:hypothetical protein